MSPELEHGSSSEDEDAPEELTFQHAKSRAEDSARRQQQEARREKALLKEKRRLNAERFKEQKKRKLLSEEILQNISAIPEQPLVLSDKKDALKEGVGEPEHQTKKRCEKKLRPKKRLQDNYDVMRLADCNLQNKQEQKAKSFIRNTLYGRRKNRATANELLSLSIKRSIIKKPAVRFTDNNWAKDEKMKAERFMGTYRKRCKL
uniref:Nucleolar protein 7 n=1 Tax=Leptobrachium leishanense TaxID=445787 RepID=A0A8C5PWC7_9ANUR